MGWLWSLATVLGPILFIVVVGWAIMRNRAASPQNRARSEQGARELREEINEDARRES